MTTIGTVLILILLAIAAATYLGQVLGREAGFREGAEFERALIIAKINSLREDLRPLAGTEAAMETLYYLYLQLSFYSSKERWNYKEMLQRIDSVKMLNVPKEKEPVALYTQTTTTTTGPKKRKASKKKGK